MSCGELVTEMVRTGQNLLDLVRACEIIYRIVGNRLQTNDMAPPKAEWVKSG